MFFFIFLGNQHCEVKCHPVPGFIEPKLPNKFGLMPHGTPCELDIPEMDKMERLWPRKKGFSAKCLGGYCRVCKLLIHHHHHHHHHHHIHHHHSLFLDDNRNMKK